jgi:hypothetical protein
MFFESINLGDNDTMRFGCVDVTSEGGKKPQGEYGSVGTSTESGSIAIPGQWNTPMIAIRSKKTVNSLINTRDSLALSASAYGDAKSVFRIWKTRDFTAITENDQSWTDFGDGHLEYIEFDNPNVTTPISFDTAKAEMVFSGRVNIDETLEKSLLFNDNANSYITPGDMFILTMHRENQGTMNAGVTCEFAEEI